MRLDRAAKYCGCVLGDAKYCVCTGPQNIAVVFWETQNIASLRAAFEPIIYLPLRAFQNAQQLIKVHAAFYNGVLVFLFHT